MNQLQIWGELSLSFLYHKWTCISTCFDDHYVLNLRLNCVSFLFAGGRQKTTSWQLHDLLHPRRTPESARERAWERKKRNDSRSELLNKINPGWRGSALWEEDKSMADSQNSRWTEPLRHKPSDTSVELEPKPLFAKVQRWFIWRIEGQILHQWNGSICQMSELAFSMKGFLKA